jgi:uncharacterized protein
MNLNIFNPYEGLAENLLPHAVNSRDGSHDLSHIVRVWKNAFLIQASEGGDPLIIAASVLLHDCVWVQKDSSDRSRASALSANKASDLLRTLEWTPSNINEVAHAIESHSFSAGILPKSKEAKILQDADRLDAIGMIGVARCFYVAGQLGQTLYDLDDPDASRRPYDDSRYAIDHFQKKLMRLSECFQTVAGKQLAKERHERLQRAFGELLQEI